MKEHKELLINELKERIDGSDFLVVTDYTGLDVPGFNELRSRLREQGAECHVYKNSYLKRAAAEAGLPEEVKDSLSGQTAIITGEQDVCATAKVIKAFSKEFSKPVIRGGILDGDVLSADQMNGLASLPPREVLLGQLLGVLVAPASKLVRTLNEPAGSLARVLAAKPSEAGAESAS